MTLLMAGCASRTLLPIVSPTTQQIQTLSGMVGQVSPTRLSDSMDKLFNGTRVTDAERQTARDGMAAELSTLTFTMSSAEVVDKGRVQGRNLILTKTGTTRPNEWVILMAHFDTVPGSPGADDNGSGCAVLMEIARQLSGHTYERTIQIVFTDLEEQVLLGSKSYIDSLPANVMVIGVINLDMVGFTSPTQRNPFPSPVSIDTGDFLAVVSNVSSLNAANDFVRNLKQAGVALPTLLIQGSMEGFKELFFDLFRGDHAWFWTRGIPAVFLTDTADFRSPHYHQSTDVIATLDITMMTRVAQAVLASAYVWSMPLN